jgi:folylpolyglutamate synthase/dihydropteroate synthase
VLADMTGHLARKFEVVSDPASALERAIDMAQPEDVVFSTGSLYLVGDLRSYWKQRTSPVEAHAASARLPRT